MKPKIPPTAPRLRFAIVQIARNPVLSAGDQLSAFQWLTQEVARVLDVERVSIWLYTSERNMMVCQDLFQRAEEHHSHGFTLSSCDYPLYFKALDAERVIHADDAVNDPHTFEFAESYLKPLGIRSMLDAPIRLGGEVVGVVCQEHVGFIRQWSQEEQEFAAAIGDLVALAMDFSQRKQTEQALREREELFRAVTDTATDAMVCTDPNGHITIWNRAASAMFGFAFDEVIGQSLKDLSIIDELMLEGGIESHRKRAHQKEGSPHAVFEVMGRRKNGSGVPVEISVAVFQQGVGWHKTYIIRDISVRKNLEREQAVIEQRTQQAQKLESLGVLAGGIAHDFNNLLGAALGRLELMRFPSQVGRSEEHLAVIETTMQRAAELCSQLLAYAGRGAVVEEYVDLNGLVDDTLKLIQMSISKKAELSYQLSKPLPTLKADPAQIQQVIMNLLTNASEALRGKQGEIVVRTGVMDIQEHDDVFRPVLPLSPGQYVFIEVEDNGEGMSDDVQARLFEPFFSTKFTGRGLGLAAVLGIVRRLEGSILAQSERGIGTKMRALFPASDTPSQRAVTFTAANDELNTIPMILVVDDEQQLRTTVALVLKENGFKVLEAEDGEAAVALFEAHSDVIDCVLLDLIMPKMDGADALAAMNAIREDIPVVLMSGFASHDVESESLADSGRQFLQKPFQMNALLAAIRRVMAP